MAIREDYSARIIESESAALRTKKLLMDQQALPFVHPAVEKYVWTVGEVVKISLAVGISPALLTNILMGRVYPHEDLDFKLTDYLTHDDLENLRQDYDPLRFFHIIDSANNHAYQHNTYYPISLLKDQDAIRMEDGRWCVISHIRRTNNGYRLFSNGAFLLNVSEQSFCQAAVYRGASQNSEVPEDADLPTRVKIQEDNPFDNNKDMEVNKSIFDSIMSTLHSQFDD